MMIDGRNIKTEYGCTLTFEGDSISQFNLSSVLRYPDRETVEFRNWAEINGIDPDLSDFNVKSKSVKLQFLMEADTLELFWTRYRKLIADITLPKPHTFVFEDLGERTYRYDANSSFSHPMPFNAGKNLTLITLDFIEEKPYVREDRVPFSTSAPKGQFSINGYDFGEFGLHVESGTDDLLKYPSMKDPFTDGKTVDFSTITLSHKEVKFDLWQIAKSKEEFLRNHAAFWNALAKPGTIDLYINILDAVTGIYYNSCGSYAIEKWSEKICAARFSINITVPYVNYADGGGTIYTYGLWDDDNGFICDEDGSILIL